MRNCVHGTISIDSTLTLHEGIKTATNYTKGGPIVNFAETPPYAFS